MLEKQVVKSIRNYRIMEASGNWNGHRKTFVAKLDGLQRLVESVIIISV